MVVYQAYASPEPVWDKDPKSHSKELPFCADHLHGAEKNNWKLTSYFFAVGRFNFCRHMDRVYFQNPGIYW